MYWTILVFIIGSLNIKYNSAYSDKIPPGVPPQNYQGHQHPPHIQQTYEQPFQQQHHVPVQQHPSAAQANFQQIPAHQQQPVQQPHAGVHYNPTPQMGGHHDHQSQMIFNQAYMNEEKSHIQEHLEVPIDINKMTEQELQFHYFKMHDADNNSKLDGCELIKSLLHWHEQDHKAHEQKDPASQLPRDKLFTDAELETLIDPILIADDKNGDGFIDYTEFIRAQKNSAPTGRHQ